MLSLPYVTSDTLPYEKGVSSIEDSSGRLFVFLQFLVGLGQSGLLRVSRHTSLERTLRALELGAVAMRPDDLQEELYVIRHTVPP